MSVELLGFGNTNLPSQFADILRTVQRGFSCTDDYAVLVAGGAVPVAGGAVPVACHTLIAASEARGATARAVLVAGRAFLVGSGAWRYVAGQAVPIAKIL
jgi:hypothetical protein